MGCKTVVFIPGCTLELLGKLLKNLSAQAILQINEIHFSVNGTQTSESFFFFFCCALWLGGLLVPQPGSETVPSAVETQCLNHWIAREFPEEILIRIFQNNSQEEQFDSF